LPARRRPPVSGQVCSGGRAHEAPLGLRSWSNWRLTSIGLAYDGAKRPVSLSIGRTGQSSNDTIGRTYDLDGNVASETQTLNLSGGSGSQSRTPRQSDRSGGSPEGHVQQHRLRHHEYGRQRCAAA
jgi:hypothetical protein